jgi:hypothetical protein
LFCHCRIPTPTPPDVQLWPQILKSGLIITVIAFSSNISLAKTFAQNNGYSIDPTQVEMQNITQTVTLIKQFIRANGLSFIVLRNCMPTA